MWRREALSESLLRLLVTWLAQSSLPVHSASWLPQWNSHKAMLSQLFFHALCRAGFRAATHSRDLLTLLFCPHFARKG